MRRDIILTIAMLAASALIAAYLYGTYSFTNRVRSDVDGRVYTVHNREDKQDAANIIGLVMTDAIKLLDHLRQKYPRDDRVARLVKNFDPSRVSEGIKESGFTSYSVNKGERLVLCVRDDDDDIASRNLIVYVLIHELAHLATDEVGHTPDFWKNMKFLVQEAVDIGIYKVEDYKKNPRSYCGMRITSSVV